MGIKDVALPDDTLELAEALAEKPPSDTRHAGVYVIYNGDTDEPLYVGESKNVYQRLFDHHQRLNSGSKTVRELVEADEAIEKETEDGKCGSGPNGRGYRFLAEDRNASKSREQLNHA